MFPATMAYEPPALYAEAPSYMYNTRSSPSGPFDEGDMRAGSSNLSTTSAPSAASSAVGSPQSNHGQLAAIPEWAPQTMTVSPNIVGQHDYFPTGTEYSTFGPGMDEYASYDFCNGTKPHGFVDPSLIHPEISRPIHITFDAPFQSTANAYPNSPALSHGASSPQPMMRNGSHSDESKEKSRCPHPDCGKAFKDLKAHMLTHQTERPEKCPIQTCEYHTKGFSRKYDRNRHTLTHYKGTMVCGFCPGSGSAAEKSFNRADVFKRHLTAVHGVEQTPPNSRKKTPSTVTCSQTFGNAQDFYEHLDDCVLRIVQQEDPAEAVNAKRLQEVENDREEEDEDMQQDDEDEDEEAPTFKKGGAGSKRKAGNPANGNRRDYPSSWGFDKGQMTMKKRVMAVFEGPRRLAKDDMMLSTEHEVRVRLSDVDSSYVTDLDVQTLKRAEGFLHATDEEKGPWISDDPTEDELKQMRDMLSAPVQA
ncbi:unnamed protein product [Parascedosporium putredinis]|uniref:C2H2-type domain-containing protein n=1 Tax=Parascedosporium putredinis TaxID=1442378 RepID=A0A9P1M9R6_9PEZI|nr:unnamed protein product [Parascedosporium putredinis]CAI7991322.1 unnamed protein product [Parascedosporium putredinis]